MSLADDLRPQLPYLRRYARAITGGQQGGDAYVRAALEAIVGAPEEFDREHGVRVGLYQVFHRIWDSGHVEVPDPADDDLGAAERAAQSKLRAVTPLARQVLLLTALEGFSEEETAAILGRPTDEVARLAAEASDAIAGEERTSVLIIEDEPLISMELEAIVRDLGHDVSGTATTHGDALKAVGERRPGLVLADIALADGSSGIDAVKDILAQFPVPVIFVTAFPERLLTGERPEPTFLITKPFQPRAVKAAVSQALFFEMSAQPV